MKVPQIKHADRYVGLYIVDFGDHCSTGYTAEEVAELLETQTSDTMQVYKIHNAYPDGRMELTAVRSELFQMESGMFFYALDLQTARDDFERLCTLAESLCPPARAKAHLSSDNNGGFVTALIYPAEYDDQFSRWLLDGGYRTAGAAEGGTGAVSGYYDSPWNILEKKQLWSVQAVNLLKGQTLRRATRKAMVR